MPPERPEAAAAPAADEIDPSLPTGREEILSFKWKEQNQETLPEGVTFYGSLEEGTCVVYSRRLAGVPLRISLAEPMPFGSLSQMFGFALGEGLFTIGAERSLRVGPEVEQEGALAVGDYPVYREESAPEDAPFGYFRKPTPTSFEIEVPWQLQFAQIPTGRPLT